MTQTTATNPQHRLLSLLERLRQAKLHYNLHDMREGAISIDVFVPGEQWQIDVLDDRIDVEIFRSDGEIHDECKLDELFQRFSG